MKFENGKILNINAMKHLPFSLILFVLCCRPVHEGLWAVSKESCCRGSDRHTAASHRRSHAALHPQTLQHLLHQCTGDGQGVWDGFCRKHGLLLGLRGLVQNGHEDVCGRLQQAGRKRVRQTSRSLLNMCLGRWGKFLSTVLSTISRHFFID